MATNWEQYLAKPESSESPESNIDWEQYRAPEQSGLLPQPNKMPNLRAMISGEVLSPKEGLSRDVQALGRGFTDIGQGAEQILGMGDPKAMEAERQFYETTPAGRDPFSQELRSEAKSAPFYALGGAGYGLGRGLLTKLLGTAVGGGIGASIPYVKPDESRAIEGLKGGLESAGMALLPEVPRIGEKIADKTLGFGKAVKNMFTPLDQKGVTYGVQKAHDALLKESSGIYKDIENIASNDQKLKSLKIDQSIIDEAQVNLPKTRATKKLIEDARSGDYAALHKLQSDLGKRGTKSLGADLYADRNIGEEMLDTREKINDLIDDHFRINGRQDLADLLLSGRNKYRYLKDTYYSHPGVAKLVHAESRKMPKNPLDMFSEESVPMSKLLKAHPELKKAIEIYKDKKYIGELISNASKVGMAGTVAYGGKKGVEYLMDENESDNG